MKKRTGVTSMARALLFVAAFCGITRIGSAMAGPNDAPPTEKKAATHMYHGMRVDDDYEWLEDWNDSKVQQWSAAENHHARAFLDALPGVPDIRNRVTELLAARYVSYLALGWRKGTLLALKFEPPKQQPFLVVLKSADDASAQ